MATTSDVQELYEAWIYPEPIKDLAELSAAGRLVTLSDPGFAGDLYWPTGRRPEPLRILVAGCGANQAAQTAFANPQAQVVGVDLSASSLAHEERLQTQHDLQNLELRQLSLFEVEALDREFDLILSTGVLHHTPDPDRGLRGLRDVLHEDGVVSIMLYSDTLRAGVYMLQDAFRTLGLTRSKADIDLARRLLGRTPEHHTVRAYAHVARGDLQYDGGIADTFLHPLDRPYSVRDVGAFAASAEMAFLDWITPWRYRPETFFAGEAELLKRLAPLDALEQAHAVDKLTQVNAVHRFFLAKPGYAQRWRAAQARSDLENAVLKTHALLRVSAADERGRKELSLEGLAKVAAPPAVAALLEACDGEKTLSAALAELTARGRFRPSNWPALLESVGRLRETGFVRLVWPAPA